MLKNRVIPVLSLIGDKLVKTISFKNPNYIGDPVNAVKILNDKKVDEVVLLDIRATVENREPNYAKIEEICSEAFMPFAYGGGIKNLEQIQKLFSLGIEKVVLNSILANDKNLVKEAVAIYGSQSIIASIDVKKSLFSNRFYAFTESGKRKVKKDLIAYITEIQNDGVGEFFINSIDRDGTYKGYELDLIQNLNKHINVPIVIAGGAAELTDFKKAIKAGASAVAAGSLFVYRGKSKGILVNYPSYFELEEKVFS